MSAILAFLTASPWRAIALGLGLLLALSALNLKSVKADLKDAKADLKLCEANVGTLETALETQNKAVKALKDPRAQAIAQGPARLPATGLMSGRPSLLVCLNQPYDVALPEP